MINKKQDCPLCSEPAEYQLTKRGDDRFHFLCKNCTEFTIMPNVIERLSLLKNNEWHGWGRQEYKDWCEKCSETAKSVNKPDILDITSGLPQHEVSLVGRPQIPRYKPVPRSSVDVE